MLETIETTVKNYFMNYEILDGGVIEEHHRGDAYCEFYWTLYLIVQFEGIDEPVELKLYNPTEDDIDFALNNYIQ
jgi:hypothetical protein